jgi:hypothetical protein
LISYARNFALAKAGNNKAAKMAMMAITTNNSIRVNPATRRCCESILICVVLLMFSIMSNKQAASPFPVASGCLSVYLSSAFYF